MPEYILLYVQVGGVWWIYLAMERCGVSTAPSSLERKWQGATRSTVSVSGLMKMLASIHWLWVKKLYLTCDCYCVKFLLCTDRASWAKSWRSTIVQWYQLSVFISFSMIVIMRTAMYTLDGRVAVWDRDNSDGTGSEPYCLWVVLPDFGIWICPGTSTWVSSVNLTETVWHNRTEIEQYKRSRRKMCYFMA